MNIFFCLIARKKSTAFQNQDISAKLEENKIQKEDSNKKVSFFNYF